MKKLILAIAIATASASAIADNYIRLPVKGIQTSAGQAATHPATSGLAGGLTTPVIPVEPDPVDDPSKPGVLLLTPETLTLPTWTVGMPAVEGIITLKNTGKGALNLGTLFLDEDVPGMKIKSTSCGAKLSTTKECTYVVSYLPTWSGALINYFWLQTDGGTVFGSIAGMALMGTSVVTPSSPKFTTNGSVQTMTVSNNGSAPMKVSGVALTAGAGNPGFALAQESNCLKTLATGETCSFQVSYHQSPTADITGTVTLTHNGGGMKSVSLTGWAPNSGPIAVFSPDEYGNIKVNGGTMNFSTVWMTSSSITETYITNTGNKPLTISSVSVTGASFSIQSNNCGTQLSPGVKCRVIVKFAPKAASNTGTFTFASDSRNGNLSFNLTGNGN